MAKIIGTGSSMPRTILTNQDMERYVETSDDWIVSRTGIRQRHISDKDENTGDLGYAAGLAALENAGIAPEDLDYILVATTTPHALVPNTSSYIQAKLGAVNAAALDINAACSGFIYGLELADVLLMRKTIKNVLVIGAEVLSKITDFTDRSTCVLFGDGAGAAVLTKGEGLYATLTGADGAKGQCLHTSDFAVRNIIAGDEPSPHLIQMDGKEVYKFAVNILPESVKKVVEEKGHALEDLDWVIPHQANVRIIEAASKRLGIPMEKFFVNIGSTGNTSAASIAIALDDMNKNGLLKKGQKLAMVGFGGGLTYGAVYLEWTKEA